MFMCTTGWVISWKSAIKTFNSTDRREKARKMLSLLFIRWTAEMVTTQCAFYGKFVRTLWGQIQSQQMLPCNRKCIALQAICHTWKRISKISFLYSSLVYSHFSLFMNKHGQQKNLKYITVLPIHLTNRPPWKNDE